MRRQYLGALLARYGGLDNDAVDPMGDLLKRYQQYKNTRALDLAAVALSLGEQPGSSDELNPLALKALHDTNPNFDPSHVGSYSDQEWMGIVNSAKGKYFEYLVVAELNAGGTVGDLTLPDGYSAHLASSMTQPGWDMQIVDEHGGTAELLQLKATDSVGYLHDTLERYPEISILTTSEVSTRLGPNDMVIDSKMSEADLEHAINATATGLDHGYLDEFWDNFHPLIPLLVIVATQGYRVAVKKEQVSGVMEVAKARAARGLAASAAGAFVKALSGSWIVSALGAVTVGMLFDRSQNIDELVEAIRSRNRLLAARSEHYQALRARA
jgi:hypothetical protein